MFMQKIKDILSDGTGLAIVSKLPTTKFNEDELKQIYWILSNMIARPVAQSFDGRLLYDVIDTGQKIGTRTRGDLTNQELSWHTDYGFNFPPPFIGLLVIAYSSIALYIGGALVSFLRFLSFLISG